MWWKFCFQFINLYAANLAAFLTMERQMLPIESLDDLTSQSKIDYAPIKGSETDEYFWRRQYIDDNIYTK